MAHHYITLLIRDPCRNLAQILPKLPFTHPHSQVNRTSGSGSLTGEPPSASTLDSFEEASDSLSAKGGSTAVHVSTAGAATAAG